MHARRCAGGVLVTRLSACLPPEASLTAKEETALLRIGSISRSVRRGADIIVQGHSYDRLFVLADGFALRYKIMPDGRRQVLNVSLPGDLIGFPACFFQPALYSVTALTEASACAITFADLVALFHEYPRLAIALYLLAARETAIFGEHLADVGWRSAYERLAHFILEVGTRLASIGVGDGCTFEIPLTQAKIADVVGLSIPHVNRMLRRMRAEHLLELTGSRVRILDREALVALADFNDSYLADAFPMRTTSYLERRLGDKLNGHDQSAQSGI